MVPANEVFKKYFMQSAAYCMPYLSSRHILFSVRQGLELVQGEWNILKMGNPKYIGQCKMVRFKTIYIESLDTGASIPLMTDGIINVSFIQILDINDIKSHLIFSAKHGHDGRLCQLKTDILPVLFT